MTFDNLSQNYFGLVALIVSCVALLTTVIQVLQQYYSSAEGYRRCASTVMGKWHKGTQRRLRWNEFRFEVVFETPVILTSSPTNTKGPLAKKPVFNLDATKESYTNAMLLDPEEQVFEDQTAVRIHTADDERASWLTLITTIQNAERFSRAWDLKKRKDYVFSNVVPVPKYPLAVQLQRKVRSWDFISPNVSKPYATTAICHLVEVTSMLGLYWKVFDQTAWNLRAEGNGFILTSTNVHGLGVMVVFATTGRSDFTETRVIPCYEIKDLAFGTVSNIFEDETYLAHKKDAQSLELVFGSDEDVNNTLESLGCQAETLRRYKKDHKHIFSVSFEIIGMLGSVYRIRGSSFRMLPNPTSDNWLKKIGKKASWKTATLMAVFQRKVKELIDGEGYDEHNAVTKIYDQWQKLSPDNECVDEANISIDIREAIHDALDRQTEYLLTLEQSLVLGVVVGHITKVVEVLEDPVSDLNTIVLANKEDTLFTFYFHEVRLAVIDKPSGADKKPPIKTVKEQRNVIWISLMFRMLCWLMLHEFDKSDIKVVPSDLKGSRMPIYIG